MAFLFEREAILLWTSLHEDLRFHHPPKLAALATEGTTMDNAVSWVVELAVKPGKLESFRALMAEMVASTREEHGALTYQWFVSDDGSTVHIYERYASSAAVLEHLQGFGAKFAERFLAAVDPTRFTVYGAPSDEAKQGLSGFNPTYLGPFGGFAR
jgi:quinol monooxygenase YgiN